ncbi:MAG: ThiF family adenylyltransferase [Bacteroidota bacterium]
MISQEQITEIMNRDFSGFTNSPVTSNQRKRGVFWAFKGLIQVNGISLSILIGIPKNFPLNKPIFFIDPHDSLGFIPHVEPDGFICFIQDQNLILDYSNPAGVLTECFKRTIRVLEEGEKGENKSDFLNEFETYWARNADESSKYFGLIQGGEDPHEITIGINDGIRVITHEQKDLKLIKYKFKLRKPGRVIRGIYIPIKEKVITDPPPYDNFWSLDVIRGFVKKSVAPSYLEKLLDGFHNKDEYIVLGIPDNKGQRQLVGIKSRKKISALRHPLLEVESDYKLLPFSIERIESRVLVPRGGGNSMLETKKVLIIGCGSLGGCIALNLAKIGFGNLTLCDPEYLKRENIHRHILGLSHLGIPKVRGLKEYIEGQIPTIMVFPNQTKIENVDLAKINQFDLVIVATGEPTINRYLNDEIRKKNIDVNLIFCWNEPYGIGGHALFTNSLRPGCYSCIHDEDLHNRASFCCKQQPKAFTQSISGCSGLYVPFSYLDSTRTAEIASRLAVKCIGDSSLESQIISWKGDSLVFLNEGFNLSNRYLEFTDNELYENRTNFISEACLVC